MFAPDYWQYFSVCFIYRQNGYSYWTEHGASFRHWLMSETEIGNIIKVAVRVKKVHRESTMQKTKFSLAKFSLTKFSRK